MSILNRPGWANKEIINEGRLHNDKLKERIGKMFDRLSLGYSPNHVIDKIATYIRSKNGEKIDINKLSDEYIINVANSDFITKGRFTPSLKSSFATEYQNTNSYNNIEQPLNKEPVSIDFSIDTKEAPQTSSTPIGALPSEDAEDEENCDYKEDEENQNSENSVSQEKIESYLRNITDEELEKHKNAWQSNSNSDEFDTLQLIHNEIERRKKGESAEEVESFDSNTHDSEFNSQIPKQNMHRVNHPNHLKDKKVNHESVKLSPQAVNRLLKENYAKKKQHDFRIEQRYYNI